MLALFKQLRTDETAASAMEYGLIAALVSLAAILSFVSLGESLSTIYNSIASSVVSAGGG